MTTKPETITPQAALLGLAGLTRPCNDCTTKDGIPCNCLACGGSGKVPVLPDLREPCPDNYPTVRHHPFCRCKGTKWLPKQGREALHEAMNKDRWGMTIESEGSWRRVTFYLLSSRDGDGMASIGGQDANDHIAAYKAYKAMKEAGYG